MLQAQVTHNLGGCLGGDGAHLVVERYAAHAHGCRHLFQADLATAHVLQHKLLDVAHQLLIHGVAHRVVANGVLAIILLHQLATLVDRRLLLGGLLKKGLCAGLVRILLALDADGLVVVGHRRRRHTGVAAFEHTCLTTLDGVHLHLYRSETHQLVEAQDCLLDVERLGEVVVGCQRDVQVGHILL